MNGGRAVLLGNHGALAVAANLETALSIARVMEDAARVFYMASLVGRPVELPPEEVDYLAELGRRTSHSAA